jgi:hypothetical protein
MRARAPTSRFVFLAVASLFLACGANQAAAPAPVPVPAPTPDLRPPEAFASIADRDERSRALFLEATRVMLHPRCVNCHPVGDAPHQRELGELHDPPVTRGPDDRGVPAMRCDACHQDANVPLARVPGAPGWHLAPQIMAWEGKTPAEVCAQVKDPARNGQRSLDKLVEHSAHDKLIAWAWAPGSGRAPPPGSQERFGALVAAWVESGAACPLPPPSPEEKR